MWLGLGLRLDQQGAGSSSGGGSGTALTAPTLTRTSSPTTYPPLVDFNRPIDWFDADSPQGVMQRSQDPTFATGVSEVVNAVLSGTTTYNFGLSSIASGSWFIRMAAWKGSRPASGSLNWSNYVNVGDVVAPTVTVTGPTSFAENGPVACVVSSNEYAYPVLGGADVAVLELSTSALTQATTVRLSGNANANYEAKTSYSATVTYTDPAGNVSSATPVSITITNQVENPSGLTNFASQTGAALSTTYRPTAQTIAGLPTGYAAPASASGGTLVKNGVNVGASSTYVNGDTITVDAMSSSIGGSSTSVSVPIGGEATPVTITFQVQTTGFTPADLWLASEAGDWWDVTDMSTMYQDTAGTTPVTAVGQMVKRWVGKKRGTVKTPVSGGGGLGPTLQFDGTYYYLQYSSASTTSLVTGALQVANVTDGTFTVATAVQTPNTTTGISVVNMDDSGSARILAMQSSTGGLTAFGGTVSVGATDSAGNTPVANTSFTAIAVRTTTAIEAFFNNTSNGATTISPGANNNGAGPVEDGTIRGQFFFTYKQYGGEVAIGRAITSTERGNLHTWLDNRS